MEFVRKVTNSNILAGIMDLPENLRDREVEILIFPYGDDVNRKEKKARGLLEKYKDKELQHLENSAWGKAVKDKYENS